jgi:hypothetical protein
MSGGGGGGNSGGSKKDKNPTVMPMDTVQPAMPGQLDAISQQLSAGYGQPPADIMSNLMQYYAPMSLPDYSPQPTPTTPAKPTKPASTPKTGGGIIGGSGIIGGRGVRTWGR